MFLKMMVYDMQCFLAAEMRVSVQKYSGVQVNKSFLQVEWAHDVPDEWAYDVPGGPVT